ncbi:MAG: phosphoenolpyruvate kinase [Gemmatimonadota bacterium]
MSTSLSDRSTRQVFDDLRNAQAAFARAYPGDGASRQPVHTVYGGADLFRADLARKLGDVALRTLQRYAPASAEFAAAIGLGSSDDAAPAGESPAGDLAERVYARVVEKLEREPVEDFRIDFEDGYGTRPDAEEDACAVQAGREVAAGLAAGSLPPFVGIRLKPLTADLAPRAARTLDLFLTALLEGTGGQLPPGFVVTNPKIVMPEQVTALVDLFQLMESATALPEGSLRMELMVETPQAIVDGRGASALPELVAAAQGRCAAAHFGVYDYTASLAITAAHQVLDHPACDFARHIMQVALTGTGIWLSDGATNVMPAPPHRAAPDGPVLSAAQLAENRAAVERGWRLHYDHVRHSLRHGYYQGWDLNPAQLPTRYAAIYAFFLEGLDAAASRLRHFVAQAARATLSGDVFDDAATGQGLLNFFLRGLSCGAITEAEGRSAGLTPEELRSRSFSAILANRARAAATPDSPAD